MLEFLIRGARPLAAALLVAGSAGALAQQWPGDRPIKLVVAALPGSSPDLTARLVATQLTKETGGNFVVINKAGGLGIPALTEVIQAAPDGATLLIGNINTNGLAPALNPKKYSFNAKTALQPITMLSDGPSALIASQTAPAGAFREHLGAWRSHPGKYAYFGAGVGGFGHVWFLKLFQQQSAHLDLLFVPVKGGSEGYQLMQEGSVHYGYVPIASFIGQMRGKGIRTMFVTGPSRLGEFPEVPTLKELGLPDDMDINTWVGLFGPAKLSPELLKRIHAAFTQAVARPEVGAKYKEVYMLQRTSASPDEFRKFVDAQIDTYRAVGERANLKLEE
jgi:tripartite-type tricarboxylate transporter receptor subunit TctC